jgi:hypothetical protein
MKGKRIIYCAAELAWLDANRTLQIADYHAAFQAAFARPDVSAQNLHALRKRKGWRTGRTGWFEKEQAPANKGKPCAPGTGGRHPNAVATQFKRGERRGVANKVWQPIGTEKVRDGYLVRKVNDDLPLHHRWRAVHLINWEAEHGPLPAGHCLKCLDGNRLNTDPTNWECVPRGVLSRLNGGRFRKTLPYDAAPAELKPTVMAVARLKQAAQEARK